MVHEHTTLNHRMTISSKRAQRPDASYKSPHGCNNDISDLPKVSDARLHFSLIHGVGRTEVRALSSMNSLRARDAGPPYTATV